MPEPIAVLHTAPATVEIFRRLLRERLPDRRIINILDDSILPELRDNGGDLTTVLPRWRDYARIAKERGVALILNACSSIGDLSEPVAKELGIPIIRVDARMAGEAVARGPRIAVAATLRSTLGPTCGLLERTATTCGLRAGIEPTFVEGAYEALMNGDQALHDDILTAALNRVVRSSDAIVLAQASMARVLSRLPEKDRAKFLVSPALAVEDVIAALSDARP